MGIISGHRKELFNKIDSIKQCLTIKAFEPEDFIQYSQSKGGVLKVDPARGHSLILIDEKKKVGAVPWRRKN